MRFILCIFLILGSAAHAGEQTAAALDEIKISVFNQYFAGWINGNNSYAQKLGKLASDSGLKDIRSKYFRKNKEFRFVAMSDSVCVLRESFRTCWKPVLDSGRIGVAFEGRKDIFNPDTNDAAVIKKELKKYLRNNPSEQTWLDAWIPAAHAQSSVPARTGIVFERGISDATVNAFYDELIFASIEGWRHVTRNGSYVPSAAAEWPIEFLQNQTVSCNGDIAKYSTRRENSEISVSRVAESKKAHEFQVSIGDASFTAKMITPEDVKKCIQYEWQSGYNTEYGYKSGYFTNRCISNSYNLPALPLALGFSGTDRVFGYRDRMALLDFSAAEKERIEKQLAKIRKIFPSFHPDADGFGITKEEMNGPQDPELTAMLKINREKLSGQQLARLTELTKIWDSQVATRTQSYYDFRKEWNELNKALIGPKMADLQEILVRNFLLGKCCESVTCREKLWNRNGVNLVPQPPQVISAP